MIVRVDIPSIRLKPGDKLVLRPHSHKTEYFKKLDDISPAPADIPSWLKVDRKKLELTLLAYPHEMTLKQILMNN